VTDWSVTISKGSPCGSRAPGCDDQHLLDATVLCRAGARLLTQFHW
jgi:hypothetical protein